MLHTITSRAHDSVSVFYSQTCDPMMKLEVLANELLLDLFEFFNTGELIRTFTGLNARFDQLLGYHLCLQPVDFRLIPTDDFDLVFQRFLPSVIDRIQSLRLSNEETPNLPELLFTRGFTLDRFVHLQSLTLHSIHSLDVLIEITGQTRLLIRLTIVDCAKWNRQERLVQLFENIWTMPRLRDCHLNGIHSKEIYFSNVSSSIERLSIENIPCNIHYLPHLLQCTPHLQTLAVTIYSYSVADQSLISMPSIRSLTVHFGGSCQSLETLFKRLPNLSDLRIQTSQIYLNGNEWQRKIEDYFPQLKRFRLMMGFEVQENDDSMETNIDDLLTTFRSDFWVKEHQWFVRCHWNPSDPYRWTTLYTLPYAFETFRYNKQLHSKSTCLNRNEDQWMAEPMRRVTEVSLESTLVDDFSCFRHVRQLDIQLLRNNDSILTLPSFDDLASLNVRLHHESCFDVLQAFLDHAPRLVSLKLHSFTGLEKKLSSLYSPSIRRLDLVDTRLHQLKYFTKNDCNHLIRSPLGRQCEVLVIHVKHRQSMLDLIERMTNLRWLTVECEHQQLSHEYSSSPTDAPIQWLRDQLPATYVIHEDPNNRFAIQVWIDREVRKSTLCANQSLSAKWSFSRCFVEQ